MVEYLVVIRNLRLFVYDSLVVFQNLNIPLNLEQMR